MKAAPPILLKIRIDSHLGPLHRITFAAVALFPRLPGRGSRVTPLEPQAPDNTGYCPSGLTYTRCVLAST
jgi:hypothetical protein